jgi:hypothetical protein
MNIIAKVSPDFRYLLIEKDKNIYIYDNKEKKFNCNHSHFKDHLINWISNKEDNQSICSICQSMNNKDVLIITVPHGQCPNSFERKCDLFALEAARSIGKRMQSKYGITPIILVPDREREICDENREIECSIHSEYRKEIDSTIKLYKENIKFALDVHSFPEDSDFGPNELFLLDDSDIPRLYSIDFIKNIFNKNISIGFSRGKMNALHSLFRNKYGIKSFLLEINENLKEDRFERMCEMIADEIKDLFF